MGRSCPGLVALALVALGIAGCTGSPARPASSASCPVTRPLLRTSPPVQVGVGSAGLPVPYIQGWYGNAALWIGVPTHGTLPADDGSGQWATKFPWWRARPGTLTISARRLDGPGAGFQGQVPGGYGDSGFTPSGLIWPAPGCWQVTGTIGGHSLTFVTLVKFIRALRNKIRDSSPDLGVTAYQGADATGLRAGVCAARQNRKGDQQGTRSYPRRRSAVSIATSTREVMPGTSTGRRPAT
jgi:hypothetical protein